MRRSALAVSLVATAGVILLGVLQGIVVAVALAILLFFRRNWWPHGAVLGRVDEVEGWHDVVGVSRTPSSCPGSSSTAGRRRCSSPTRATFREQIRRLARERKPALDRAAVRGDHRRRRDARPRCSSSSTTSSTPRGSTSPSPSCATRLQELTLRYGLMETLDRDHFYPTLEAALEAIAPSPRADPPSGADPVA